MDFQITPLLPPDFTAAFSSLAFFFPASSCFWDSLSHTGFSGISY
jgi:hypothetical protein